MAGRNEDMSKRNIEQNSRAEKIEVLNTMLRITRCRFREGLHPWDRAHFLPTEWYFYYNPTPGGYFYTTGTPPQPFLTDRVYLFPRGYSFFTYSKQPFSHFYIHYRLYDHLPDPGCHFELSLEPHLQRLIEECIATGQEWRNIQRRTILAGAVIGTAMSRLPPGLFLLDTTPDRRIERICELLESDLRGKFSNAELAARAGLSCNSFIRLFREKTGETPQQFRLRKCVEYAAGELHYSSRSIDEIAEAAGFADRFHFSKVFGRIMQLPPAAYRKITRGQKDGRGSEPLAAAYSSSGGRSNSSLKTGTVS